MITHIKNKHIKQAQKQNTHQTITINVLNTKAKKRTNKTVKYNTTRPYNNTHKHKQHNKTKTHTHNDNQETSQTQTHATKQKQILHTQNSQHNKKQTTNNMTYATHETNNYIYNTYNYITATLMIIIQNKIKTKQNTQYR